MPDQRERFCSRLPERCLVFTHFDHQPRDNPRPAVFAIRQSKLMNAAYLQVVILLHAAFAGVFFFLNHQSPSEFTRRFGWSWVIEACRAAILLHVGGGGGPWFDPWYCGSDVLGFAANWFLLTGGAHLAHVRLPRWIGIAYFGAVLPVVVFSRYGLPRVLEEGLGLAPTSAADGAHLFYLFAMFLPVGAARLAVVVWLFRVWKKTALSGALIACLFCIPFAVVALAVPIQELLSYSPSWITLLWCMRVLGFSMGLVILMLNMQQAAVAKSESSLKAAQSLAQIGSWELDLVTGTATWSAEMYRLYGQEVGKKIPAYRDFLALIHPRDRKDFEESEALAIREHRASTHEFRVVRPDAAVRWIQGRNTPCFDGAGKLVRIFGVEQDITDRKRAEARMKLQHAVTRLLAEGENLETTLRKILELITLGLDGAYSALWILDRSSQMLRCVEVWHAPGEAVAQLRALSRNGTYGVGEGLPGRVLADAKPAFGSLAEVLRTAPISHGEAAQRAGLKSGGAFPILLRSDIFGVVETLSTHGNQADPEMMALFSDLGTQIGQFIERQRLEEQYRLSQKMEAVGTLAGGIAHDFNNILTAINGYCELAQMEAAGNAAAQEHLNAVQAGARRAVDLVRQIMAFSRQQGQKRTQVNVQAIVEEALKLLRATIPSTIEIKTSLKSGGHPVLADPTSIHQVMVNLCTNAWHSMKDRPGRLEVKLENICVDADFARLNPTLNEGSYVRISISDTGHGMDQSVVARIFEPFFTTKAPGEGTGLGLAVVHGIMKNHDGAILVHSRPGEGTRFDLYFPAYFGDGIPDIVPQTTAVSRGAGELILYVDDEKPLAQMGRKILEHLGYRTETYSDVLAALSAVRLRPNAYDLVITDLTMPVMTGLELAQEIFRIRPDLPIILTSGYTATLSGERLHTMGIREVLMKPHSVDLLGATVHRVFKRESESRQIRDARAVGVPR